MRTQTSEEASVVPMSEDEGQEQLGSALGRISFPQSKKIILPWLPYLQNKDGFV